MKLKKHKVLIIGLCAFLCFIINGCQDLNSNSTLGYLEVKKLREDNNGSIVEYTERAKVPSFNLLNQDNQHVSNTDLLGYNYIVNFFFTSCPTICPTTTLNLKELQNQINQDNKIEDFKIISISVDPNNDTPKVLRKYASSMDINVPNWEFLTGSQDEIYHIVQSGFSLAVGQDSLAPGGVFHSSMITIVDDQGYIRTGLDKKKNKKFVYDGTLLAEVKLLMDEIQILSNKGY